MIFMPVIFVKFHGLIVQWFLKIDNYILLIIIASMYDLLPNG